jgi:hypothetical protein
MASGTIWSQTKDSVTTDAVESRLEQFLPALCMTRDGVKFTKWSVGTVEKAFKWADYLFEVSKFADVVQKQAIVKKGSLGNTGIGKVDANPTMVLDDPIESLIHAIITSPYLSWMQNANPVLKRTFSCAIDRKGEKDAVKVCVQALNSTLDSRISFKGIWDASRDGENVSDAGFAVDEESLAFELVVAFHSTLSSPSSEREEKHKTLEKAAREDLITFRMLCIAVTFSPSKVACLEETFRQCSGLPSSSIQMPSWERLYEVSKSRALVDVAASSIRNSFSRFLSIDDDHGSLLTALCREEDTFVALFSELQAESRRY